MNRLPTPWRKNRWTCGTEGDLSLYVKKLMGAASVDGMYAVLLRPVV